MGVTVKTDFKDILKLKSNVERQKKILNNQVLSDMNQFVPADGYDLRGSGHVNNDSVEWNMPYAKAQFYGSNGKQVFRKYTTSGTGKRWDLKAKRMFIEDWKKIVVKGVD